MSKRGVTVFLDEALEDRVNRHRVDGRRIRSFSDVAREAMSLGLDLIEGTREQPTSPPREAA